MVGEVGIIDEQETTEIQRVAINEFDLAEAREPPDSRTLTFTVAPPPEAKRSLLSSGMPDDYARTDEITGLCR